LLPFAIYSHVCRKQLPEAGRKAGKPKRLRAYLVCNSLRQSRANNFFAKNYLLLLAKIEEVVLSLSKLIKNPWQ
jgi:hypothetical protein